MRVSERVLPIARTGAQEGFICSSLDLRKQKKVPAESDRSAGLESYIFWKESWLANEHFIYVAG